MPIEATITVWDCVFCDYRNDDRVITEQHEADEHQICRCCGLQFETANNLTQVLEPLNLRDNSARH